MTRPNSSFLSGGGIGSAGLLHGTRLAVLATRLLGPRLQSQFEGLDLVQEAWGETWSSFERFEYRGRDCLYGFISVKMRRIVADWARRGGSTKREIDGLLVPISDLDLQMEGPAQVVKELLSVSLNEIHELVVDALHSPRMPAVYRDVLRKVILEGRARDEVALEHGVKPETLRKQVNRGLQLWREILAHSGVQEPAVEELLEAWSKSRQMLVNVYEIDRKRPPEDD